MVYYKLTNISGGLLVCDLNHGGTLRLAHKQSTTVPESEITSYILNLIVNYVILCEEAYTSGEEYIPPSSGGNNPDNDDHFGDNTMSPTKGVVRYDSQQALTSKEKAQARQNIGSQKLLIEHTPEIVLSTETGLVDRSYSLIKLYDSYSVYLVKVSDTVFTQEELNGLFVNRYDSSTGNAIDSFLVTEEDTMKLTDNGSFLFKDCLCVVSKQDKGITVKGGVLNFSGTYILYEAHKTLNSHYYYELRIPSETQLYDGVSTDIESNPESDTIPTVKAVYDYVNSKNKVHIGLSEPKDPNIRLWYDTSSVPTPTIKWRLESGGWVELTSAPSSGDSQVQTSFITDETLTLKDGVLSVNRANVVEGDNTLPITSAAVYTTVGNIEAILKTI